MADKADVIRKKIVATKEGGAITGEERLREFMDDLYGGILTYEGKPTATLLARTAPPARAGRRAGRVRSLPEVRCGAVNAS